MKFSESWLREWVNPAITSDELMHQITMAGLEVDDSIAAAAEFTGIVVGKVVSCAQHPDADKLQVTKIDVGAEELLDIVCGAANCREGLTVAVATVGAVLPGNFKIKKAKLRGQLSLGMLCSEQEMGMLDSADGIIELPADAPIGTDIREYLKLNDTIIDIDLTPNRADCLSLKGVAREVAALNDLPFSPKEIPSVKAVIDDEYAVELAAADACPRYLSRIFKNIDIKAATPLWMVEKLRRGGIRSIDAVVDITNFVLLELGQPMHAFDLQKLDGPIVVRKAKQDEKLQLLDESEVTLNDNTLVITDNSGPIAMAGIFGGLATGTSEQTQDILLECAFFSPLAITGRARSYGLHTDSSHRFERGVDYNLQVEAMERASALIIEICGGDIGPVSCVEDQSQLPKAQTVTLSIDDVSSLIGITFTEEQVTLILSSLGMLVEKSHDNLIVTVPSYRFDIAIAQDLIEEVARVFGYNNIPNLAPQNSLEMVARSETCTPELRFKQLLASKGYQEAITYSFVDPKKQAVLHPGEDSLILPHPISVDMSVMRLSLFTGLLDALSYNQKRQQSRVRLFETGLRFVPDENAENGVNQTRMITGVIAGSQSAEQWSGAVTAVDFFDLKGDVEDLLALSGSSQDFDFETAKHSAMQPGQTAAITKQGQVVGHIGALHPKLQKTFALNGQTYLFELKQEALEQGAIAQAGSISKFQASRRDIAIVVDKTTSANKIMKTIKKVGGDLIIGLNLFDVYQGSGIADDKKSLAISLTLVHLERTLEEKEISAAVDNVVAALKSQFDATLRD